MSMIEKYVPHAHFSVAVSTVLLVIVGFWGVKETKSALELSQRAWISPLGANLTQQLEIDRGIHFAITLVNSGREPATDVNVRIKNYVIDSFNLLTTDMSDVVVPENTTCNGLTSAAGKTIIAPTGSTPMMIGWALDSMHGEPQFPLDDRITKGTKFYVVTGCIAYVTYSIVRKTSFCYVLARGIPVQVTGPPNVFVEGSPPQRQNFQLPGYNPLAASQTFNFSNCSKGFDAS